LKQKPKTIY